MKPHYTNTRDPIDFPGSENPMTEQIRELARQAGQGEPFHIPPEFVNRFTELIVRECIAIADDLVDRNEDGSWTSTELYTDYNGALFEVKRRIEKHFGFEE